MTRILLIEDEPQHTELVKIRLKAQGMEIHCVDTAAAGAKAAAKDNPDLILMDLLLPDMRPEEAVNAVKAAGKAPIIAFTALDPMEIRRRHLDSKVSGLVTKPYEARELLKEIKRVAGK
jgi:DNA-binding response OmpR family regulator